MSIQETKLNLSQEKVVNFKTGAVLVVAGAGTGKTRVITERIKSLIEKGNVVPKEILALTFTEKASEEMLTRTGDVMPLGYEEPFICTFHSFADRILRTEGLEIGLDISYKILTDPARWLFFRKNLFKFDLSYFRPLGNPTKFISGILKFISRLQDENISTQEFRHYVDNSNFDEEDFKRWQELANTYEKYEELKLQNSKMDFGDLIVWLIKLFKTRSHILEKYQKQFKHVMVDEFQDTNYAQYELIKMLYPNTQDSNNRGLLVVGDDSQSVYKFRGAAVSNILEFRKDYENSETITLLQNYRSNQLILDTAYNLILHNNPDTLESKLGISKRLISCSSVPEVRPVIYQVQTLEDEVELVISEILKILAKEAAYTYKDVAILARANNHLDPFVLALKKYGLPYQLIGNRGLYDQEEVRDILALIKSVADTSDSVSLYRVLNINSFEIPAEEISKLLNQSRREKVDLWDLVKLSKNTKTTKLAKKLESFRLKLVKFTPTEFVYELISSLGYLTNYIENESVENELKVKNVDLFLGIVKRFEVEFRQDTKEIPTIIDTLDYIDLNIEAGDNPAQAEIEDIDTISLMTVHASKGLEFPVVFIVNTVSDRFPTRNRSDQIPIPDNLIKEILPEGDAHIQEERRLFYVALTRAKKYLFITFAINYGGSRKKIPSGFLSETKLKLTQINSNELQKKRFDQLNLFGIQSVFKQPLVNTSSSFLPDRLSYTQISKFETCPLQYKYSYILKIPSAPNYALSFGISIHETLRDFHTKLMFKEKPSIEDMLNTYKRTWKPLGYISEEHKEYRFESGKKLLEKYFERQSKCLTRPARVEETFNFKLDNIKFYGRIDRIDKISENSYEIIDYKTGKARTQKEVDKDLQVTFYAIGAIEALKIKPTLLSLYYLEEDKKISTTRTPDQLNDKKQEIRQVLSEIKTGDFKAKPGMHCKYCDYKSLCPHAYKN